MLNAARKAKELETRLDDALNNETTESLTEWLNNKRNNMTEQEAIDRIRLDVEDEKKCDKKISKLKDKEVVSMKIDLPKEIQLNNSSPLVQAIKEEQSDNTSVPKSIDSQQVSKIDVKDEPQIITINGQNSTKNKVNAAEAGEREENNNFLEHTVKKGETLFRIAVYFDVVVAELWAWNNLTSTIVKEGTVLKIKRL
jgi:membrane-bound lytic murein transglycosylase D